MPVQIAWWHHEWKNAPYSLCPVKSPQGCLHLCPHLLALSRWEHNSSTFLSGVWMLCGTNTTTVLRIRSVKLLQNSEIPWPLNLAVTVWQGMWHPRQETVLPKAWLVDQRINEAAFAGWEWGCIMLLILSTEDTAEAREGCSPVNGWPWVASLAWSPPLLTLHPIIHLLIKWQHPR